MKDELRLRFRAIRDSLSPALRRQASGEIARHMASLPRYRQAGTVALYASFGSEVDTGPIQSLARSDGKRLGLPRMAGQNLELREWGEGLALVPNRYRIPEPSAQAALMAPSEVDLFAVPGLVFDHRGARLGYGGGYYDRLLKAAPRAYRVGIAFQAQLVRHLPSTQLDVPVDCLITESGVKTMPHRKH